MNQCSASTSAFVWRFRRGRRRAPFLAESRETRNEKRDLCPSATLLYTALHCCTLLTLLYTGCRQFSCYFESAKSQVLKRFIFLHTDLQLQRCPSVRLSSFLLLVPPSFALSLFLLLSLSASFFLICCKFLIKKFRFNAAIDCTFCRHHHNNLLTHLAPSAPAALHLFRLNFLVFARGVIL